MSKGRTAAIGVADILCRVWQREARLLAQDPVPLRLVGLQFKLSQEARRSESVRLGAPLHKPRVFDVMLKRFFAAAREIKPGCFTDESVWPRSAAMYCEYRETGKKNYGKWNAIDIEGVVDELERGGFAVELLRVLWRNCREECKDVPLPEPPGAGLRGDGRKRRPGRPKGSYKSDALARFVKKAAERLEAVGTSRIPVKQLVDEYKKESGYLLSYEAMRTRMRDALGRR